MPGNLLDRYKKMRDFGDTPEPSGREKKRRGKQPIFVIQKHQASHLHYDFRIEMEGVLKSWAVPKGPSYDPGIKRLAMMTEDHPYEYASFEGVIPEGNYGAGNVIIWDEGTWEFIEPGDDPVKALRSGKLAFRLNGKKMFGEWALVRIKGRTSDKGNEWLLLKHRDEYANEEIDVTEVAPRSVVSNRLLEEVSPENVWVSDRKASFKGKMATLAARLERQREEENPAKKKAATKSAPKAPRRPAAPSRAASSRNRNSPAESPRKGRTIRPRPPR